MSRHRIGGAMLRWMPAQALGSASATSRVNVVVASLLGTASRDDGRARWHPVDRTRVGAADGRSRIRPLRRAGGTGLLRDARGRARRSRAPALDPPQHAPPIPITEDITPEEQVLDGCKRTTPSTPGYIRAVDQNRRRSGTRSTTPPPDFRMDRRKFRTCPTARRRRAVVTKDQLLDN